ncbi:MAG: hypothetical protein IJX16_05425 [Clostridia bacterium]|nr:hypothetical protein [Clostridia bacterium]
MVKHKPKKNVEYTFVIPETGRIITIRFLDVSEKNRLIFLNTENNNTLDFHPSRFSFLYEKHKVKELAIKELEQPTFKPVTKDMLIEEPEMTKEDEKKFIAGMIKELRTLSSSDIGRVISATGRHPGRLADDFEKYFKSDIEDEKLSAQLFT